MTPNSNSATLTTMSATTKNGVTSVTASSTKLSDANASRPVLGTIFVASAFSALTLLIGWL
jgi:hypothetical protein